MKNLLVELLVEELPPKDLRKFDVAWRTALQASLLEQGLIDAASSTTSYATPRRLAVHVTQVAAQAPDKKVQHKLMPVSVGLSADGQASPALLKKLTALGFGADAVPRLTRAIDGKAEALFLDALVPGVSLAQGLQLALTSAIDKLPIKKVMTYQLEAGSGADFQAGWTSVKFVRPAHGLVALYGEQVVPVTLLGLQAGKQTSGHRFEALVEPIVLRSADTYVQQLEQEGAVVPSYAERRAQIQAQLQAAASQAGAGLVPIDDEALLDEVTALVERPNVLIGRFEEAFLEVPPECLILTMKANQKYFPLVERGSGRLSNQFLIVSNISPQDASAVVQGNERVVRPRLADAKFFYDQDRKKSLLDRAPSLDRVVYHHALGSQGERSLRVTQLAGAIADALREPEIKKEVLIAARIAKADLLTDMVGEFPELQGIMGRYYALHDGHSSSIALAVEDHYKPRFAGDELPRNLTGIVLALADKMETLVGLFGIGQVPTGDKDPFALRRHALGVIRMLTERTLNLSIADLIAHAKVVFGAKLKVDVDSSLTTFFLERLATSWRDAGYSSLEVDAVLALQPQRLGEIPKRLAAVRSFAALPQASSLSAANKRVGNILKKVDAPVPPRVDTALLHEAAELSLAAALSEVKPQADAAFERGDYTASLQALAALKDPVDQFFESVMVNVEDPQLRANRLGLLASLQAAMNRVADLSKLATGG